MRGEVEHTRTYPVLFLGLRPGVAGLRVGSLGHIVSASSENVLEMQILRPHRKSTEWRPSGGSQGFVFCQAIRGILVLLKFESCKEISTELFYYRNEALYMSSHTTDKQRIDYSSEREPNSCSLTGQNLKNHIDFNKQVRRIYIL